MNRREEKRRSVDKLSEIVTDCALHEANKLVEELQAKIEVANKRIDELEQLLAECEDELLSIIAFGTTNKIRSLVLKIEGLFPPAVKQGE